MIGDVFRSVQLLHALLLVIRAVGFFILWGRTRFWLPKYAHILAAVGLAVGLWCAYTVERNAPLGKRGPAVGFLVALLVPAMVYFFFVFCGGQKAALRHKPKAASEIADLIERFLDGARLYPQEWMSGDARSAVRHPVCAQSPVLGIQFIVSHDESDGKAWSCGHDRIL